MNAAAIPHLAYVIEDEHVLADIFARALEKAGYQTLALNDGKEAIDHLKEESVSPRLVVLDLNLPRVSGREILRYIRANDRFTDTRVILATSDAAAVAGELNEISDLVLLKPISPVQLRDLAFRLH